MTTASPAKPGRLPITIITGFVGSGKTTLLVKLLPQLRAENPGYTLALIKSEIGTVEVDSLLAASDSLAGSAELGDEFGSCLCCTNIGQIEGALIKLDEDCQPDRIVIETSGSAEPLKLALEVHRIGKATGRFELDGVVSVVDAENWGGYKDLSHTAKLQAQQTDLIVINKWEALSERGFDLFLDKLGDLDVDTPQVKSDKGWISKELLFGFDATMAKAWLTKPQQHGHSHDHAHGHDHSHTSEIECLSVALSSGTKDASVDLTKLETLLKSAPKDEVYRIKAIIRSSQSPKSADETPVNGVVQGPAYYILNWSFGRWTWTHSASADSEDKVLRMSIFTAPYESNKWAKKAETGGFFALDSSDAKADLVVKRVQ
ncbi:hypothetical protein B0A48_05925 [Cryoendolithus antarcticus]|uniref:CobW/HypB/UreG nucleotide-binding domain-containing protein n=1 Tax=Cryoendolithus antarcticus TaxID=1507870 RepID=A0A1V8TCM3_9PEZI|nr:hypothetical protein B0A48_05925 [Cryoendolithus antarcticus]